ncbi:putative ARM repeat superfamily protein [Quillaja saponaria]|uniref:ARM repeat superfamily protein n=1 Tax=Quillaja saponaria TaxID=32244 RepID=A0AAD7LTH2_QUISA|nr:putative ARM repeat superfamily protein [Quillaja saponaria]
MSESSSTLRDILLQLSEQITESLRCTAHTQPEGHNISVKAILDPLLPTKTSLNNLNIHASIKDFALACSLLSSASFKSLTNDYSGLLSCIPNHLSGLASSSLFQFSKSYLTAFGDRNSNKISELGLDWALVTEEKRLMVELMPEVLPLLKEKIKESSIDKSDESDEFSAASARAPVGFAIVAAYQFRWFVTQVDYPHLGKLCCLLIPCALTALDHWSPEVKGQGMFSFTHLAKNVNTAELCWYEDVILDACCQNIASSDEIWRNVVEMAVALVTCTQKSNPRSTWSEKMLIEMLSHLERQPKNKERRIAWLEFVEPLFNGVGLVLLAHFRRVFPLFFKWIHADDDETVQLVLRRIYTVLRLTWIRNTPYIERLLDELAVLYKEAALRRAREEIRTKIREILILLQQSKGLQFSTAWNKHRDDPNLITLGPPLT